MVKKLCLLLCLILRVVVPVFAAEERKGLDREEVQAAEGVIGDDSGLDLETDYQIFFVPSEINVGDPVDYPNFFVPKSFINRFEYLRSLLYGKQVKELHLYDSVISFEDLSDLQGLISNPNDLGGFDFMRLAQLLNLANELGANQQTKDLLEPAMNRLHQDIKINATPELALKIKSENGDIKLSLLEDLKKANDLSDVSNIIYAPNGIIYWVIFSNGIAERYNAEGEVQGALLDDVSNIVWQPDGSGYWVIFLDGRAQRYNKERQEMGVPLLNVSNIVWQPDGSGYWVIFSKSIAQRYNAAGETQGDLFGLRNIVYQPQNLGYWMIFNERAQRYDAEGQELGEPLLNVSNIVWQPDGSGYWVIFLDGRAQKYNSEGKAQGVPLMNVRSIVWQIQSLGYWVINNDSQAVFYPDYNFRNLPLYQQVLIQYLMNESKPIDSDQPSRPVVLDNRYLELLGEETIAQLQALKLLAAGPAAASESFGVGVGAGSA